MTQILERCPVCGAPMGNIPVFQQYELYVAECLQGRLAPPNMSFYDVYQCEPFPELTFQVKSAHLSGTYNSKTWGYFHPISQPDNGHPSYFVLIGIDEKNRESLFLVPRSTYFDRASKRMRGDYALTMSPKRGTWGWGYYVRNPRVRLIDTVLRREGYKQLELI